MIDDHLFNGFEFVAVVAIASLLIGLLAYQPKNPLKFYHEGQDERHILRRQSPLVYAAIGVILAGITSMYGVVGEPFEITGYVDDKRQSRHKAGVTHILVIRDESYGVLRCSTSEKLWSSQHIGSPLLLKVQRNLFGLHIIRSIKPLEPK
ncbi:hypothetical protein [Photobacterium salinisoli]|uniref:hypothetical protein n=1 Tax=Photobacterium salinisoli TaxID=1616783 RepID=UPI0013C4D401|nr:hypothetical protein [Photobacterium salinisoli]